jgi:beta-phosphoglucomutase-like phosphatase (HAD superfamily)
MKKESEILRFRDSKIHLIIFDCDGTLVDSEYLYNSITSELLNEIGYSEYTPALCLELFAGMAWSAIRAELEIRHQTKMPDDIIQRYIRIANERMSHDFNAAPHACSVVDSLSKDYALCVASNGERNNVIKSLEVTGLLPFFSEDRLFTKIQVARPKPAPDLFLFACARMNTAPQDALVIEDSLAGVRAAKAAGIRVLGYVGTAHDPATARRTLADAGADDVISSLLDISKHLE